MAKPDHYRVRLPDGTEFGPASMMAIEQWAREGRVPTQALLVAEGSGVSTSVLEHSNLVALVNAPPTASVVPPDQIKPAATSSGIDVLIPTKNTPALVGYYLGVASLIPGLGLATGPVAIILGIMGIVKRRRQPEVHGMAHAITAVVLGAGGPLFWIGLLVLAASL